MAGSEVDACFFWIAYTRLDAIGRCDILDDFGEIRCDLSFSLLENILGIGG